MKSRIKIILRKLKIMPENPVDESTVSQCEQWDFAELQLYAAALGIDAKKAVVDLFRQVPADRWHEAERRLRAIRSKMMHATPEAVMAVLARDTTATPPAPSISALEAAARAWRADDKPYASFVPSVWQDIVTLAPQPGPIREWLTGGLSQIASGHASKLGPRPADPPAVSAEEFHAANAEVARKTEADHKAMRENEKAGRGRIVTPQAESVG